MNNLKEEYKKLQEDKEKIKRQIEERHKELNKVIEQIKQETIKELPKTGINVYTPMVIALVSLISLGLYFNKKNNK